MRLFCLFFSFCLSGFAASPWTAAPLPAEKNGMEPWIQYPGASTFRVDPKALAKTLEGKEIELPLPGGRLVACLLEPSSVMAPALAAKFPELRTWRVRGIRQPVSGRIDDTPNGFHAQLRTPTGMVYIDPAFCKTPAGAPLWYSVYRKSDAQPSAGSAKLGSCACGTAEFTHVSPPPPSDPAAGDKADKVFSTGNTLRTYRLAMTATAEFTQFHGGTVADAMAAIVTGVNRVNEIYERELAIRLELVANNDLLLYTDPATDPYPDVPDPDDGADNINSVIGDAAYDIGHIVTTTDGGLAFIGSVCNSSFKGSGLSGAQEPRNDPFWVDFVCHEIGHQFGAPHTYNSELDGCNGQRISSSAFEPGSGSTIMAYAGLCGTDDLQGYSNPYFHAGSLQSIQTFLSGTSCAVSTPTGNTVPTVSAGPDLTIPARTPFVLTATGNDADGDDLTYCWEQMDLGSARILGAADNGSSPLFRSFEPAPSPSRTFPRLGTVLAGIIDRAETLPNQARAMKFRVTVRDNRQVGGVHCDNVVVNVIDTGAAFALTAPNGGETWSGARTITWNPAGTAATPINANTVDLHLSLDGGLSFPITLASGVPNDGNHPVVFPQVASSTARVRVQPPSGVFFDISNSNFNLQPAAGSTMLAMVGPTITDAAGNGNNSGDADPGESSLLVPSALQNNGTSAATGLSGTLRSLTPTATVLYGQSSWPDIAPGQNANATVPFLFALDAAHPCNQPVDLLLEVDSDQGTIVFPIRLETGDLPLTRIFSYSAFTGGDPVVPIPDNTPGGVTIPLTVSGIAGTISGVRFRIGGNACSGTAPATGNGINHSWIGDLELDLISPQGTHLRLKPTQNTVNITGPNLCQVLFDDDATQDVGSFTVNGGPYTGAWRPNQPLSSFLGENPNGTWRFEVSDLFSPDTGDVREFSLEILEGGLGCGVPVTQVDTDGDGLPDAWEMQWFGSPTAALPTADGDGDGYNNLDEYLADSNPTSSGSFLRIDQDVSGEWFQAQTSNARLYQLEFTGDLFAGTWNNLGGPFPGSGAAWPLPPAPSANPGPSFFRLKAMPYAP